MVWKLQTNFSSGVLDPKLDGRIDLELYYNGVKTGENIFNLPQGGVTRRPGFEYLATLASNSRLFAFEFNTEQQYVIAFDEDDWFAYDIDGTLIHSGSHTFGTDIFEADYVQSGDVLILVHGDNPPAELRRTAASTFAFSNISLLNIPQYNYDDNNSPIPTSNVQSLTFASFNTSDRYRLVLQDFLTAEISYAADAATNAARIEEALLDLPIIDSDPSTVTVTGAGPFTVTFSGNSADAYSELNGVIVSAQSSSAAISATITTPGVSKREDVWSGPRGWPKTVIFHEGRLVFGGSGSLPATIWLSFANDFFNFKTGTGLPDEAIVATLDTDQLNEIVGLSTNRNLQIFTTGQEFFVPVSPITPETIVIKPQSRYGAKEIKPKVIDGFTCYIQRTGAAVRRFVLTEFETQYESVSVSLLAPELIRDPVDMTVQKGVFNIDASYLYIVNDDGTLAVYLSKKLEGLNSWALWNTQGNFKYVASVGDDLFACVEREINGVTTYFLEKLYSDPDTTMWCDAGVYYDQAASDTITGLAHLNGEEVRIVADGAVQEDETVASGSVTLTKETETGWLGLNYNPQIDTMPAAAQGPKGEILPLRKRWVRVRPQVLDTSGLYISDGRAEIFVADRQFNIDNLDTPPNQRSGIGQGVKFLGWTYTAELSLYQKDPLPLTILALYTELK